MNTLYNIILDDILHQRGITYTNISGIVDAKLYSREEIQNTIKQILRDHPEIFWFAYQYEYLERSQRIIYTYLYPEKKTKELIEAIEEVITRDFHIKFVETLSQEGQVAYVYRWLIKYCNYNTNSAYNQGIDSVFIRRNSVCAGYAKAAQYLFNLLGIESRLVYGTLNNCDKGSRHCWNLVKVGSNYYHIDICLGDNALKSLAHSIGLKTLITIDDINYNLFCVSTNDILKTRSIEEVNSLPKNCTLSFSLSTIKRICSCPLHNREGLLGCLISSKGTMSNVYLCSSNKNVVIKKYFVNIDKCIEEYRFMDRLRDCKHILHLVDLYSKPDKGTIALEQAVPIIDIIKTPYLPFTLKDSIKMIKDIAYGIEECYWNSIFYRDIHLNNIYKCQDGLYKIADFGSCSWNIQHNAIMTKDAPEGSPWFMAPETYKYGGYNIASATYSLTLLFYFILNDLTPPFCEEIDGEDAYQLRIEGKAIPPIYIVENSIVETTINSFIAKGLSYNPDNRYRGFQDLQKQLDVLLSVIKNEDHPLKFSYKEREYSHTMYPGKITRWSNNFDCERIREDIIESEISCPNCHHTFNIGISRHLFNELAPQLRSEYATGGTLSILKDENELLHCPFCHYNASVSDYLQQGAISITSPHNSNREYKGNSKTTHPNFANKDNCSDYDYSSTAETFSKGRTFNIIDSNMDNYPFNPSKKSFITRLFKHEKRDNVFSSVFAPASISKGYHFLVQIYLHTLQKSNFINILSQNIDKNSKRRGYSHLHLKLKKGDSVDVTLTISSDTCLKKVQKKIIWDGELTHCNFDYFVPNSLQAHQLYCEIYLSCKGILIGEMNFITEIAEKTTIESDSVQVCAKTYNRIFISYAHEDIKQVQHLAQAYKAQGADYFFDKHNLRGGDVYEEKILSYIDSADLFILCWSQNAAKSDYVAKEKRRALSHAFPQISRSEATLTIYPISIEPRAKLPNDMDSIYNFEVI